ncbi:hypothetical protein [Nonomuraea sp. SBT364]|uniref:hypothetical protein n=1 Tax=Nonomuraea sp. SBT364 TaxID=1580530 RepID=UPI00066D22A4|nr:hypothetical protein [Nonomuraea sp. SBT364]
MVLALRRLMLAIAIVSGLGIASMPLVTPHAHATTTPATTHVTAADDDDDDDDRPRGGVDTGHGGTVRDDDDDDRPRGGVDTGQGGTARDDDRPRGGVDTGQGGTARDDDRPRGGVDTGQGGTARDDDRPHGGVETGMGGSVVVEGSATRLSEQRAVSAESTDGTGVTAVLLALGGISVMLMGAYLISRKLGRG